MYNAQLFLKECLDSIINQTYTNIEIILVNDGSTDNSKVICEEYADRDSRIKIIEQENSGPSVARNVGIGFSKGKYIQFVDSDDIIDLNFTQILVDSIDKSDLVLCGYKLVEIEQRNQEKLVVPDIQGLCTKSDFINKFGLLYRKGLINPIWNKLYKNELIEKGNIKFNDSVFFGEDLLFNLEYIAICNGISIINEPSYNYIVYNNASSLTGKYHEDFFENQKMLNQKTFKFLINNNGMTKENKLLLKATHIGSILGSFSNICNKGNKSSFRDRLAQITSIVSDEYVEENIENFFKGDFQKSLVGHMMKNKRIYSIYIFFKIKEILREYFSYIFVNLKKILAS